MKFNGIRDDETRGRRIAQTGCKFAYTDAATITLTPNGFDGKGQLITSGTFASATSTIRPLTLTGSLTCILSTGGGGGLDTGSEATDKGYYVFVIAKPAMPWSDPLLLCSLSETAPTMPSGYTYRSDPVWFMSNDGDGDLRAFIDVNGTCYYAETGNAAVVSQGLTYSDWAEIDCSPIIPNNSMTNMNGFVRARETTGAWNSIIIHTNDSDTNTGAWRTIGFHYAHRVVNASPGVHLAWNFPILNSTEGFYYKWAINPGSTSGTSYPPNFYVYCRSWRLI